MSNSAILFLNYVESVFRHCPVTACPLYRFCTLQDLHYMTEHATVLLISYKFLLTSFMYPVRTLYAPGVSPVFMKEKACFITHRHDTAWLIQSFPSWQRVCITRTAKYIQPFSQYQSMFIQHAQQHPTVKTSRMNCWVLTHSPNRRVLTTDIDLLQFWQVYFQEVTQLMFDNSSYKSFPYGTLDQKTLVRQNDVSWSCFFRISLYNLLNASYISSSCFYCASPNTVVVIYSYPSDQKGMSLISF